jgi:hypothetical protein
LYFKFCILRHAFCIMKRPTRAEIHLDNLAFNLQSVKNFIGGDVKLMAVVKADAYGHGAARCAQFLGGAGGFDFTAAFDARRFSTGNRRTFESRGAGARRRGGRSR